jgi:hypothetical protein
MKDNYKINALFPSLSFSLDSFSSHCKVEVELINKFIQNKKKAKCMDEILYFFRSYQKEKNIQ